MSPLRVLAALVIVLGGGYIGMLFAAKLTLRVKQLDQLLMMVRQIGFNISFLKMPISEAISSAASSRHGAAAQIFKDAAEDIKSGKISVLAAIERALASCRGGLCITDDDTEILTELARNLGRGDAEYEMNNINAAQAKLELARSMAQSEREQKAKLSKGMGLLCGMLVALILL